LVNKTPKRTKKTIEDILGEIGTAREEFPNTMRETLLKRDQKTCRKTAHTAISKVQAYGNVFYLNCIAKACHLVSDIQ
jgi:hypothetical protein